MKITKLKTLTILCCLLATTFVCSAQTFDENGFNTNPSATDNQYQEPTVINGVYQIANAGNLYWFANYVDQGGEDLDAKAVLISDIVVNENLLSSLKKDEDGNVTNGSDFKAWTPMKVSKMFFMDDVQVTLDGNGHTISGLYVDDISTGYVGLFGEVAGMVFVSDLGIEDSYFKGESFVGGLVGLNTSLGTFSITNSYNAGTVRGSDNSVGGLVGYSSGTLTITNSYNAGAVSGNGYVGGLVGFNNESSLTITNSFFLAAEGVSGEFGGTPKSANEFHIGLVALMLHNYVQTGCENDCIDGTIWGQNLKNGDLRPNFSSEINIETQKLVLHTFDDDTRVYPTEYIAGQELPTGLTREGFVFLGWSSKEVAESSDDIVTSIASDATGEKEFYAQWKAFDDDGCFAIASTVELYAFANVVNNATEGEICGTLAENIVVNTCDDGKSVLKDDGSLNCSGEKFKQWTPMNVQSGVQVTFNGNGKTISGLYFDNGNKENVGLFGGVYGTVDISNLNIVDSYFKGKNGVGGLVGYSSGENAKLSIANSYNAGSVSGTDNVGGLVGCGKSDTLTITSSYNAGTVAGRYDVGGLVGFNDSGTLTVTNSYNVGAVSGTDNVGGLVGANEYFSTLTITNSYNAGTMNGDGDNVGGLVGANEYFSTLTIAHSFFLATGKSGDGLGGEAKTSDEFADGTVAKLLFTADSIWGQNTSTDTIPNFSGKIIFTVSVTASDNGTISGTSGEYEYNTKFAIEATPNEGYHFVKWSNGSTKTNDTILVVSDTALVATFTAHEFGKWDTIQAATCTEYGLRVHTCSCGAFDIDTIPALGHSFTNYIYNNDATIEADGTETATCDHEGCHATDTRIAEGTKLGATVAVNDLINENIHIYTHNHTIVIEHAANDIIVYDAKGQLITHRTVTGNSTEQINVINSGIYIVKCGNTTKCVICN